MASPVQAADLGVAVYAQFEEAGGRGMGRAVTFDSMVVPVGSRVTVTQRVGNDGTRVQLQVHGVEAGRTFGAHVHRKPCGSMAYESGTHYQHQVDSKQPSTDPAYANPRNEVWLDFATDGNGDGSAGSAVVWRFREGEARSVVIHERAIGTRPGTAGAPLACVNVPFK